jgi:hypothetical protein
MASHLFHRPSASVCRTVIRFLLTGHLILCLDDHIQPVKQHVLAYHSQLEGKFELCTPLIPLSMDAGITNVESILAKHSEVHERKVICTGYGISFLENEVDQIPDYLRGISEYMEFIHAGPEWRDAKVLAKLSDCVLHNGEELTNVRKGW